MKNPKISNTSAGAKAFLDLGGDSVLDFCNTLVFHGENKEDRLVTPLDAKVFWQDFFESQAQFTSDQFGELIKLRSELREAFTCIIEEHFSEECIKQLNSILQVHPLVFKINIKQKENKLVQSSLESTNDDPVATFLVELHRFLNELDESRLKKCSNPNCSHLFYDRSKNNLRTWCSMKTCGNIMKARAFQKRKTNQKK